MALHDMNVMSVDKEGNINQIYFIWRIIGRTHEPSLGCYNQLRRMV